jgi:hypothetical protein
MRGAPGRAERAVLVGAGVLTVGRAALVAGGRVTLGVGRMGADGGLTTGWVEARGVAGALGDVGLVCGCAGGLGGALFGAVVTAGALGNGGGAGGGVNTAGGATGGGSSTVAAWDAPALGAGLSTEPSKGPTPNTPMANAPVSKLTNATALMPRPSRCTPVCLVGVIAETGPSVTTIPSENVSLEGEEVAPVLWVSQRVSVCASLTAEADSTPGAAARASSGAGTPGKDSSMIVRRASPPELKLGFKNALTLRYASNTRST